MPVGLTGKRCDSLVRNLKKGNSAKMGVCWAPKYSSAFRSFVNNRMPGQKWQFKYRDIVHTTAATTNTTTTTEINIAATKLTTTAAATATTALTSSLPSWLEVSALMLITAQFVQSADALAQTLRPPGQTPHPHTHLQIHKWAYVFTPLMSVYRRYSWFTSVPPSKCKDSV
jgi:hypothetical protein